MIVEALSLPTSHMESVLSTTLSMNVPASMNTVSPAVSNNVTALMVSFGAEGVRPEFELFPTADVKLSPLVELSFPAGSIVQLALFVS